MLKKIKETIEWFFRHGKVSTGTYRDRELTFAKQYLTGGLVGKYKTLLDGDYPDENVFMKMLASVGIILDPCSTAFNKQQGLVQKATDARAILRSSLDNADLLGLEGGGLSQDTEVTDNGTKYLESTNFTVATQPHQLPNCYNETNDPDGTEGSLTTSTANGITLLRHSIALSGDHAGKTRMNFGFRAAVDNATIQVLANALATKGYTGAISIVTDVTQDGITKVITVTKQIFTFNKGTLQSIV